MKIPGKILMIFIALFVLLLWPSKLVAEELKINELKQKIDRAMDKAKIKQSNIGLYMFNDEQVLYAKQEHKTLNPASAIKILVTAAALEHWGQAHVFLTKLWFNQGQLCIKGGLDPYFVSENLWLLGQMLRRETTRNIHTLIIDNSDLKVQHALKKNFSGDAHRAFVAPQSALALNFNALTVHVYPGQRRGEPATVLIDPDLPKSAYRLNAQVKTNSIAGKKSVGMKVSFDEKNKQFIIHVYGLIGLNERHRTLYGSVPKPEFYFAQALKHMLDKENILAQNRDFVVEYKTCVEEGRVLEFKSKPLSHIVWGMNKFSNNFMAEMLSYALAKEGVDLKQWLKDNHPKLKNEVFLNKASGLSRSTKISAHDLAQVFFTSAQHPVYGADFLHAMSVGGQDGTLRNRFKRKGMLGKVRAKSGTLNNVTALVGQAHTPSYGTVYFAFLWNQTGQSGWQLRNLEEKIIAELF
ncbi:D-alanyl-D-alanine carboxypeptidase/D-alanyl-D-alanine-endopeptidase [bacterium]|nr:D-alanyl-D-alanine carboxypeptidase/D-alanyl-D-alanine-endopeptidase [bacterium]